MYNVGFPELGDVKTAAASGGIVPPGSTRPEARLNTAYLTVVGDFSNVCTPCKQFNSTIQ